MPHIHTAPNQHDMTVSAYIVRLDESEPLGLVHMHRKHGKLLQIGGHIELDETPWQSLAHEIVEESGYDLTQLELLQPDESIPDISGMVIHPVPFMVNTHKISDEHYHSDMAYAFVTNELPKGKPASGESQDLRWLSLDQLLETAARDNAKIYELVMARYLKAYHRVQTSLFSTDKPTSSSM